MMDSTLVGAWELVSDTMRGMYIFTNTHYAGIFERKDRKTSYASNDLTDTEAAEAYRSMGGGGGTYSVSENNITRNEEFDRVPNGHRPLSGEFKIEGDVLTMEGPRSTMTFRRIR